jgi:hypothetical protein
MSARGKRCKINNGYTMMSLTATVLSRDFCIMHLNDYYRMFGKEFDFIIVKYDHFIENNK